jgi:S1-C subfamily serine protease
MHGLRPPEEIAMSDRTAPATSLANAAARRVRGGFAALSTTLLFATSLTACAQQAADEAPSQVPGQAGAQRRLSIADFSVVELRARAMKDARSARTLGPERLGSGIVIDSSGLVLTIGYLILEAESIEILGDDRRPMPATMVAYDGASGLGLLRTAQPLAAKPIEFGDSKEVGDKEPVLVVGYDGVAPAYVVSKREFAGAWEYLLDDAIFTAPATTGWSGAALINSKGKLLGVGSLVVNDAVGAARTLPGNMFVPIDVLKPILGDMIASGKPVGKARPWLGINTQDLQGKLVITRVSPESPASAVGLSQGDIIIGVKGQPITGMADFYRKVWSSGEAGSDVLLDVIQGTELKKLVVKSMDRDLYYRPRPIY